MSSHLLEVAHVRLYDLTKTTRGRSHLDGGFGGAVKRGTARLCRWALWYHVCKHRFCHKNGCVDLFEFLEPQMSVTGDEGCKEGRGW
jgi:hypothetical protein